jgi:endonuclease/exonuclease/phosphatase family metal-dependent hydrolase
MPSFPNDPPVSVADTLIRLRAALDASAIPPKVLDRNVLIATWNIRSLGRITPKWTTAPGDSPKRCLADVLAIAEVVSRFDVVALQEVKRDLGGLEAILDALGPEWGWILTDLTRGGQAANQERMAFLYDTRRVRPSGLAAELVVPIETATSLTEAGLQKQFARTPYAVSFESQGAAFTLVTLHVIWGEGSEARLPEITEIARWMADWARGSDAFGDNLMALGDFNIDRLGDPLYQAFVATGLTPAPGHVGLPRTIFADETKPHFYDQVAWFTGSDGTPVLRAPLRHDGQAGNFDFRGPLQGSLSTTELSWRVSDHYPLWAGFSVEG